MLAGPGWERRGQALVWVLDAALTDISFDAYIAQAGVLCFRGSTQALGGQQAQRWQYNNAIGTTSS